MSSEVQYENQQNLPFLRSTLFIPGNRLRWLASIDSTEADAVIVDLEDAVPEPEKSQARRELSDLLMSSQRPTTPILVRVNDPSRREFLDDIEALADTGILGVMVPKVTSADDIMIIDRILSWCEDPEAPLCIVPVLETAAAMRAAFDIASASPRVSYMGGLSTKGGDVQRALGYHWSPTGAETLTMRSQILLDARAAGVHNPMSGLWTDVEDLQGLRTFAESTRDLGYDGLTVIHPSHVEVVNDVFTPALEVLDRDRALVEAMAEAVSRGRGAVTFEGHMIDEAMAVTARQRLNRFRPGWAD